MVRFGEKELIKCIFIQSLLRGNVSASDLTDSLNESEEKIRKELEQLSKKGLVDISNGISLTREGRKIINVVFIGGAFEIIHPGHIYTIERAKRLGDVLVAVVARDSTIRKMKHREPVTNELERMKLLTSIKYIDAVILGSESNIYDTLERVRPDIVALGYDQHHSEKEIVLEAMKRGMNVRVVRLDSPYPDLKTSRILETF